MLKNWIYAYLLLMPGLISANRTDSAKSQINSRLFRVSVKSAPVFFEPQETSRRIVELPRGFLLREDISPAFKKFDKNQWTATHVGYIRNLDLESIKPELDWYVFSITGHFCTYDSSKKILCKEQFEDESITFDASGIEGFLWGISSCKADATNYRFETDFSKVRNGSGPILDIEYQFFVGRNSKKIIQFEQYTGPWECGN